MSSMTEVILEISCEDVLMLSIASTASRATEPPSSAFDWASPAISEAASAPEDAERTDDVSSSRAAAVSSSVAACFSVRRDKSSAALEISVVSPRIDSALWLTAAMASVNDKTAALKSLRSIS